MAGQADRTATNDDHAGARDADRDEVEWLGDGAVHQPAPDHQVRRVTTALRVTYHCEDGLWWADSEDAPGYYAGGATFGQLRERVREGIPFHLGGVVPGRAAPTANEGTAP